MNEVIDTFAPSLALMLTFVFAERRIARRAVRTSLFKGVVALVVCVTYVSYMTALVHRFASERLHADELAGLISFARTRTSFLVAIVIAYYFSQRIKAAASAEH